jgi:hypothetical protein
VGIGATAIAGCWVVDRTGAVIDCGCRAFINGSILNLARLTVDWQLFQHLPVRQGLYWLVIGLMESFT